MTDRELLESAAKACGYDTSHPWNAERLELTPPVNALWIKGGSTGWDPLDDDGDALRLAVLLHFRIDIHALEVWVTNQRGHNVTEIVASCLRAATRRAIVRAAAEIGSTPCKMRTQ
jgi:hypothetical protein